MTTRHFDRFLLFVLAGVCLVRPAHAQAPLSLAEALRLGREASEGIKIAHSAEIRADADTVRARSQKLPQVGFVGSFTRTLASEFSALSEGGPVCTPLVVDNAAPLANRVTEIERAASCGSIGPSFDLSELPFGQENVYQGAFAFSQALYAGGRITAQETQAGLSRQAATIDTTSTTAQVDLDVTRAFFDAALTDRLVTIAESGFDQAAAAFEVTRLGFEAGRQPEFEVLRAQVARDNQEPAVIRSRANREIAYLRLRNLLGLAPDAPVVLDLDLDSPDLLPPLPFADALASATLVGPDVDRAPVRRASLLVAIREAGVTVARAARLPSVSLTSNLARVGYPSNGAFPGPGDFRSNWSLAALVQVPVFTGRRLQADELAARADLTAAEASLRQTQDQARLEAASALQDLAAAEAAWRATAGTVTQASRAYDIADLRNREGLSTQLELTDARLALQLTQVNRARAARDLQVARARVALLPNLPVGIQ
jgi:outer membrane protein TolC